MSAQVNSFVLVNLDGQDSFIFRYFPALPSGIQTSRRVNWQAQDVTTGTQPLFYANREPRRIVVDEIWLDNSALGETIAPEIAQLFALQDETKKGTPPTLLALWGDRQERVILEEVTVREQLFTTEGVPLRAELSLTLLEVQEDSQPPAATVRTNEESSFTF